MTPNDTESPMSPSPTYDWQDFREEIRESFRLLNQRFDTLSSGHSLHGQHIAVLQAQHAAVLATQSQCRSDCQNMQKAASESIKAIQHEVSNLSIGQAVTTTKLAVGAGLAGSSGGLMLWALGKVWP